MAEIVRFPNPAAGVLTRVLREDGRVLIRSDQNTLPIIEGNVIAQSAYDRINERRLPGGFRWVARLPAVTVMQLNLMGIMRGSAVIDEPRFLQFIDDVEHRKFRTDNGRRLRNLPSRGHLA